MGGGWRLTKPTAFCGRSVVETGKEMRVLSLPTTLPTAMPRWAREDDEHESTHAQKSLKSASKGKSSVILKKSLA